MSTYDLWSALAGGWTLILALAFALLAGWSAVGITRWLISVLVAPDGYDEPPSNLDRRDGGGTAAARKEGVR